MRECRRIRDWMDVPGRFVPGKRNAITDVPGVQVGQKTIIRGDNIRTGITLIKPHPGDNYNIMTPTAVCVGNGFGKLTGTMQVDELGVSESIIGLTNTLSVPQVVQGILQYQKQWVEDEGTSMNVLVGETNDGSLNEIYGFHITPEDALDAIAALGEEVTEGSVGAGTGTSCFGYKGGIGTSSRIVPGKNIGEKQDYTVGVIIQTNFGGNLNIYGHQLPFRPLPEPDPAGSCMIVVATDAPMDSRQLKRLAKRAIVGMAATGSYLSNGSGDFAIAFSNCPDNLCDRRDEHIHAYRRLSDPQMNCFFEAASDAAREAVYNSLTMATDVIGYQGKTKTALDIMQYADSIPLKK